MKNKIRIAKTYLLLIILVSLLSGCSEDKWTTLFDGKTLDGWKASESTSSWQIIDGSLVTSGPRSHLFYDGEVLNHNFKNFEFSADVKTKGDANSGIYFHTEYLEDGWPRKGYEAQVINSTFSEHGGKGSYVERKKTGSLYGVRNLARSPVNNDKWFNYRITVQGKTIRTYINGQLMVDYTEPENPYRDKTKARFLSSGTFALQCHDPGSAVFFKNIKVKPLPDDTQTPGRPIDDAEYENTIRDHSARSLPLMDLHAHFKKGLTKEQLLSHARKYGFTYGVAFNCGLKMGFETEAELVNFLNNYDRPPQTYLAMQAEGREWVDMFSKESIDRFDYVITDSMTWTNDNGKRMRLWIPSETEVGDPADFMDQLVDRIEKVISTEPIDIYVNATYLPDEINDHYDVLWTDARMDKVVKVLAENKVAMEISARYKIPSAKFIRRAKAAGVKFTFGTNNTGPDDLGRLEYCIKIAKECKLTAHDFWYPN